jgi:hypothetical protein
LTQRSSRSLCIKKAIGDGWRLYLRRLEKDARLNYISFVFYVTTYSDPKDEADARSLGAGRLSANAPEPDMFLALLRETARRASRQPDAAARNDGVGIGVLTRLSRRDQAQAGSQFSQYRKSRYQPLRTIVTALP